MTQPSQHSRQPSSLGVSVNAGRLWAGGVATGVVAALIGVVGILVIRGVLDIDVLAPASKGAWESTSALEYAGAAFVGALLATALMQVLLATTPRPLLFFGWIMFLVTVLAGVWPFTTSADLENQIRGRLAVLGFPFPVPAGSRLVPRVSSLPLPPLTTP